MKVIRTKGYRKCHHCQKEYFYDPAGNYFNYILETPFHLKPFNSPKYCSKDCRKAAKTRICPTCGKTFCYTHHKAAKIYCSNDCGRKACIQCAIAVVRERAADLWNNVKPKKCEWCGKTILPDRDKYRTVDVFNARRFCSRTCSGAFRKNKHQTSVCPVCNKSFRPRKYIVYDDVGNKIWKLSIYCSRACYSKQRSEYLQQVECPVCKKIFTKTRDNLIHCSQQCRDIAHHPPKRIRDNGEPKLITTTCKQCGKEFTVMHWPKRHHHWTRQFCTPECRSASMKNLISYTCQTCGMTRQISASYASGKYSKYCSKECVPYADTNRNKVVRCVTCNQFFKQEYPDQKYCSFACIPINNDMDIFDSQSYLTGGISIPT